MGVVAEPVVVSEASVAEPAAVPEPSRWSSGPEAPVPGLWVGAVESDTSGRVVGPDDAAWELATYQMVDKSRTKW